MNGRKFFLWCRIAVKDIKHRPDRDRVHKELYEHLEDRYDSFVFRGWSHEEAIDKTIEAMGSADDVRLQLRKIYSPFWFYTLWVTRIILIVAILTTIFPFVQYIQNHISCSTELKAVEGSWGSNYDPFEDTERLDYDGNLTAQLVARFEPDYMGSINGFSTTVEKAALWRTKYGEGTKDVLFIRIETIFPYIWSVQSAYSVDQDKFIWARDNLGNYYYSTAESAFDDPYILSLRFKGGQFTYVYDLALYNYVSHDAQWIELCYDRDGRDYVLRVYLPGGEQK